MKEIARSKVDDPDRDCQERSSRQFPQRKLRKRPKTKGKPAHSSEGNGTTSKKQPAPPRAKPSKHEIQAMRGEIIEQVPPGRYSLAFIKDEMKKIHGGRPSLVLWFRIITPGAEFGKVVARYYSVKGTGKGGKFKAGPKSYFSRHYVNLFGPPNRYDRFNMQKFNNVVIEGTIRTVEKSKDQKPLAPGSQYSVVDDLLSVAAGT